MIVKETIQTIKDFHSTAFIFLNEENPVFYPKKIFLLNDEEHVSLFEKELICGKFYTEIVNDDNQPLSTERTLYRFKGNEYSKSEYRSKENLVNGSLALKYYVPLSDFEKINLENYIPKKAPKKLSLKKIEETNIIVNEDDNSEEEDLLMSKMTIRDYAAIKWQRPVSNKKWLNDLINKI